MWPWHSLAVCWLVGIALYVRAIVGVRGYKISTTAECLLAAELLFIGLQIVLHAKWKREWDQNRTTSTSIPPSAGARFYYVLGLLQLWCALGYLDITTFGLLFDAETFAAVTFGVAVAHGLLRSSRTLAPIPDEIQHDARQMAELGFEARASDDEVTKVAIVVVGLGIATTLILCLYISYGSYDIASTRMPWWLGVPTIIIIALALRKKFRDR